MARFSPESMLKQEEALTELDASIDDWATKLEMAENRRTRVRQKLLEHVAAAAVLMAPPVQTYTTPNPSNTNTNTTSSSAPTPPRSPTKPSSSSSTSRSVGGASSPSPQRRGSITGVPSTILENPVGEEAASAHRSPGVAVTPAAAGLEVSRVASLKRADVESIRIYAGDEITTLLASVENEITRLSHEVAGGSGKASPPVPEQQHTKSASLDEPRSVGGADWQSSPRRKALHRQQSHELLSGWADVSQAAAIKIKASRAAAAVAAPERAFSPPPPTPPAKD